MKRVAARELIMKKWTMILTLSAASLTACQDASGPVQNESQPLRATAAVGVPISGSYIVTLRDDVSDVDDVAKSLGIKAKGKLKHLYKSALKGFAIDDLSDEAVALLEDDPRVIRVEADQVMNAIATSPQSPATWGIDRVDQRALPLDNTYNYATDGTGVRVYIIDTGINFGHADFGGRAITGVDEITAGGSAADCNGHGTHVSGTVGGATYGLAKNVTLIAVRVLNCSGSGTTSGVIAGIDWVTTNRIRPAAANMSLGGGFSATLNEAVANSVAAGVTYAVAAGNSTANACNSSPSSEPTALTVGATDINDGFASFSNFGSCVDLSAPGVSIKSDWTGSTTATNTISGTSMASPHVAGAAALYLSDHPLAAPAEVASALTSNATFGIIKSLPSGTANRLLYTGSETQPPPPPSSVASFTYNCNGGRTCSFNASSSSGATGYSWNFGDGTTGSGVTTTHTYRKNSSSTVTLTTTPSGAQSSASKKITCNRTSCS